MTILAGFFLSIVFLGIASYTDIKQRVVPDKLSTAMVFSGLAIHLFFSVAENNFMLIAASAAAAAGTFFFGYVLWKMGVWAGGDVKLFTGIAALNPVNPSILSHIGILDKAVFGSIALPVFPLTLFIFSVFTMAPVALLVGAKKLMKKGISVGTFFGDKKMAFFSCAKWAMFLSGTTHFLQGANFFLAVTIVLVFGALGKKTKAIAAAVVFAAALFYSPVQSAMVAGIMLVFFFFLFYAAKAFTGAKKNLREKKKITGLEEGTIPAETIVENNGKIERIQPLSLEKVIEAAAKSPKELLALLQPKGKILASHRKASGLTLEEINKLKHLVRNKKLDDHIMVKESVAFVPGVLFAYVLLNVIGDFLWKIVL